VAVRLWENNWEDLPTMSDYPPDIRRLIYTTNTVEGYNRQLRKVTKTKGAFATGEAARKLRVSWPIGISPGNGRRRCITGLGFSIN
jgi:transposase-like protein